MAKVAVRQIGALLFAAAMLLQSMVPGGWMPTQIRGGPAIVLCDGTAAMAMPGADAMPDMPGMAHGPAHKHAPDLFGALPVTPPALPAACPPPRLVASPVDTPAGTPQRGARGLGTPPRPSTGPPAV